MNHLITIENTKLIPLNTTQKIVSAITLLAIMLWACRPFIGKIYHSFSDQGVAIATAIILFFVPVHNIPCKCLLVLEDLNKLPWNIYLLFGGGLALATAIQETNITTHIRHLLESFYTVHSITLVLAIMGITGRLNRV